MTQQPIEKQRIQTILRSVDVGMDVYDSTGDKFGSVKDMYFGAVGDESVEGVEAASISAATRNENEMDELLRDFARAIGGGDELPEELRHRLLHDGFVQVDADGLFASDRFVTPDQIASVDDAGLHLNVSRKQLIKR